MSRAKKTSPSGRRAALDAVAAEFDRELVADTFGEPTSEQRKRWANAKRRRGRPRRGKGAKVISITVERTLLARSDALAARLGVSRAGLVERGLRAVLAAQGEL